MFEEKIITAWGETKTSSEWSIDSRCVVNRSVFRMRIVNGWIPETALSTLLVREPSKWNYNEIRDLLKTQTIRQIADNYGVKYQHMYQLIYNNIIKKDRLLNEKENK